MRALHDACANRGRSTRRPLAWQEKDRMRPSLGTTSLNANEFVKRIRREVMSSAETHMENKSHVRKYFQGAYAEYVRSTQKIWSDYLSRCEETCLSYESAIERLAMNSASRYAEAETDYHTALHTVHKNNEEISERAYCRYMHAILGAWDFENALQQSKHAYSTFREALTKCNNASGIREAESTYKRELELAWTPEIAANCMDFYNDHVRRLADAWADTQRALSKAHRDYLLALQKAWAAIDLRDVDENSLAELYQAMMSVGDEPALHAPLIHSDREAAPAGANH